MKTQKSGQKDKEYALIRRHGLQIRASGGHFDREFKQMVVSLVNTGKSTNEIAEELGITSDLVRRWKREQEEFKEGSFSGYGKANMTTEQKEIARLKKELKDAQLEREILKKAISIFSKGDNKYFSS